MVFFGRVLVTAFVLLLIASAVGPIPAHASLLAEDTAVAGSANSLEEEQQESAADMIGRFHAELLVVMQNAETWNYRARRDRLAPSVVEIFDSNAMTRIASGRNWKNFDDDQRSALTAAFRALTLASYAARFNGYSGQSFTTTGETQRDDKRTFVRTNLAKSNGEIIRIDYLMHRVGKNWRIIDVFVEGRFSELAVRRSEFAPVLRDRGFPGLIEVLRSKVSELEAEDSAD